MKVKGTKQLHSRLRAIKLTFKIAGREWAETGSEIMRSSVPSKSGRLRRSFRVKSATQRRAQIGGHFTWRFIDKGTKAHTIKARRKPRLIFEAGGQTIFAKKVNHPATRAQPFRERASKEALRRNPPAAALIRLWNKAA